MRNAARKGGIARYVARVFAPAAALVLGLASPLQLGAQDVVKVASPDHIKVVLENDRVRVLDDRSKPGDQEPMHSHPACIIHVLAGGRIRSTGPDGKTTEAELKTGDTVFRDPLSHAVQNVGTTEMHLLVIELKK